MPDESWMVAGVLTTMLLACRDPRDHVDAGPRPVPGPSASAPVASATPAPIDASPPAEPFVAKGHCAALRVIADAAIMNNGSNATLPTPPGFASCGWDGTPGGAASLNFHRWYRCRSASLETLEPGFYASVSAAWRGCLRKPDWQPATTVRYPNGTPSHHAANPDAYISKRFVRDNFLFSEGFCALEETDGVAAFTCGTTFNN